MIFVFVGLTSLKKKKDTNELIYKTEINPQRLQGYRIREGGVL